MNQNPSISELMHAVETGDLSLATALVSSGDASGLLCAAADASEQRIMADLARATRTTEVLVQLADRHGSGASRARTRRAQAQALTYANRFEEALAVLAEALPLAEEDRVELGRIRLTMLHAHARQARFGEAVECGLLARDAFRAAGERMHVGRAENNLGILERMRDRPTAALDHFTRAAEALRDQPALLAHVENNRAEALLDLDRFGEAEQAFHAALREFRASGGPRHAGIVLGNLADLASRQGRLHESLVLFEQARRVMGDAAAPGDAARLAIEQADVLQSLGMYAPAARAYTEALDTLTALGMSAEAARGHLGRGRAMTRLGDASASRSLEDAERLFTEQKNATGRARALAARVELELRADRGRDVGPLLDLARGAVADRPAARAWIDLLEAGTLVERGEFAAAALVARRASETAESLHIAPLAADLRHLCGVALLRNGDAAAGAEELRQAVRHAEHTRGMLGSDRFRTSFLGDRARIWETCATAILNAGGDAAAADAFAMIERSKGRGLLDLIAGGGSATGPDADEILPELRQVTGELHALYDRVHDDHGATPEHRSQRERKIREREERREQLLIRAASADGMTSAFAGPDDVDALRASIPRDAAVLEYFIEGDAVSAAVVRDAGLSYVRRFASLHEMRGGVERLNFQIGRALARGLTTEGRGGSIMREIGEALGELGRVLIDPVERMLGGVSRLAVVPTGPLHQVPMAALSGATGHLLARMEIAMVPSASILRRLRGAAAGPALLVGVSDERAPMADAEVHAIARHCPDATILTGGLATKRAFIERCSGRGHVHFAGHARFIAANPDASGLKLADGWLTASELAGLKLGGASLMLSGCETGRVAVDSGDEQMGLARAALLAGASAVTMTLWPVHDRSTAEIMASAYGRMSGGVGIGRALGAVQREMIQSGAHPAVWASFITVCCPW